MAFIRTNHYIKTKQTCLPRLSTLQYNNTSTQHFFTRYWNVCTPLWAPRSFNTHFNAAINTPLQYALTTDDLTLSLTKTENDMLPPYKSSSPPNSTLHLFSKPPTPDHSCIHTPPWLFWFWPVSQLQPSSSSRLSLIPQRRSMTLSSTIAPYDVVSCLNILMYFPMRKER